MAKAPRPAASGAYIIVDDDGDSGAFRFAPRGGNEIPADQKKVIATATEHYARILEYIESESEQNEWLSDLKQIVSLGAVQENADPASALAQIRGRDKLLEERLATFLRPARNRLVKAAGVVFALAVALGISLRLVSWSYAPQLDLASIASYAFAVASSMPALVIQYLVAIRNVSPKTYAELKFDLSSAALDTLACAIMCVIVVALFASGAVAVNIKGLETKDVESNVRTAIVVGIICGLASRRLGPALLGLGARLTTRLR
ncbi:hypothetical protein ACVWYQ_006320 [Bradyrhizobium sp. USDA 3397]